jgi:hypothetical protein
MVDLPYQIVCVCVFDFLKVVALFVFWSYLVMHFLPPHWVCKLRIRERECVCVFVYVCFVAVFFAVLLAMTARCEYQLIMDFHA